jgi:response regulator RpfG family c-di-GMP phosphodiesterase
VAVLLLQIDQPDVETAASSMATAISETAAEMQGEVFRIRPWRYAVFVASASGRQASALAQRLRLTTRHRAESAATASIGIALWPLHGETPQELLDAAEQALLTAAAEGDAQSIAAHHGRRYAQPADVIRSIEALRALARLADHVCFNGLAHSEAVAHRAARIARILALPHEKLLAVQLAGELHEIGRLALPRTSAEAARNPDNARLTAAHAALGARIIQAAGLPVVAEIVASQYDRYDGTNSRRSLQGDAIPIGARILSVANAFETVLDGIGRGDAGRWAAIEELRDKSGTLFDPHVVRAVLGHLSNTEPRAG